MNRINVICNRCRFLSAIDLSASQLMPIKFLSFFRLKIAFRSTLSIVATYESQCAKGKEDFKKTEEVWSLQLTSFSNSAVIYLWRDSFRWISMTDLICFQFQFFRAKRNRITVGFCLYCFWFIFEQTLMHLTEIRNYIILSTSISNFWLEHCW